MYHRKGHRKGRWGHEKGGVLVTLPSQDSRKGPVDEIGSITKES